MPYPESPVLLPSESVRQYLKMRFFPFKQPSRRSHYHSSEVFPNLEKDSAPRTCHIGFSGNHSFVCTAYQIGRSLRATSLAEAVSGLLRDTRLMRPTNRAEVLLPDGQWIEMRWGFDRPWSRAIVNSRDDKLAGNVWREAFASRRCLIPMAAYYEWSGPARSKTTHRFTAADQGLLWAAGLWEESAHHGPCYSMITCAPNTLVERVHDRMPAVLQEVERKLFLAGQLRTFLPPSELLHLETPAANPLRRNTSIQDELF